MVNIIITTWKRLLRDKANTFWILCFPIILGTLFNVAFSNMAASEDMSAINVAVICEDDLYGEALKQSIETISEGTKKRAYEWLEANNFTKGIWR